jgi:hypothetical protein
MVVAAVLMSLAVVTSPSEPQSASSDNSQPYSLSGVRRASMVDARPSVDATPIDRRGSGYRLAVDSRSVASNPCPRLVTPCQPSWTVPAFPSWNQEFVAMTGPAPGMGLNAMATNKDRVMAAATNIGFALAFQGVVKLVQKVARNAGQKKVTKIRREIEAELEELERNHHAAHEVDPAIKRSPAGPP